MLWMEIEEGVVCAAKVGEGGKVHDDGFDVGVDEQVVFAREVESSWREREERVFVHVVVVLDV